MQKWLPSWVKPCNQKRKSSSPWKKSSQRNRREENNSQATTKNRWRNLNLIRRLSIISRRGRIIWRRSKPKKKFRRSFKRNLIWCQLVRRHPSAKSRRSTNFKTIQSSLKTVKSNRRFQNRALLCHLPQSLSFNPWALLNLFLRRKTLWSQESPHKVNRLPLFRLQPPTYNVRQTWPTKSSLDSEIRQIRILHLCKLRWHSSPTNSSQCFKRLSRPREISIWREAHIPTNWAKTTGRSVCFLKWVVGWCIIMLMIWRKWCSMIFWERRRSNFKW